jgi:hypothetical protein
MAARLLLFALVAVSRLAAPALGQAKDPREIKARKDCLTGNPDSGVALLVELFEETHDPNYLYNQARCYEQSARAQDAINRFREYLRVAKNITPQEKAEVDKHIEDCRGVLAEQEQGKEEKTATAAAVSVQSLPVQSTPAQPAQFVPVPPSMPAASTPHMRPGTLDLTDSPKTNESRSTPIYKTWWFWTGAAAVVAAGTVTAIVLSSRSGVGACDGASLACMGVK